MVEFLLILFVIVMLFVLISIYGFIVPFLVSLSSTFTVFIGGFIGIITPFITIIFIIKFLKMLNTYENQCKENVKK